MQFSKTMRCFIYFTEDKSKTDRGAVIEARCKQREKGKGEKRKKQRQGQGGKYRTLAVTSSRLHPE